MIAIQRVGFSISIFQVELRPFFDFAARTKRAQLHYRHPAAQLKVRAQPQDLSGNYFAAKFGWPGAGRA
jgi:hypothetical protein